MSNVRYQAAFHGDISQTSCRPMCHLQSYPTWLTTGKLFNRHTLQCRDFTWTTRLRSIVDGIQSHCLISSAQIPNAETCHPTLLAQITDQRLGVFHCQQNTPSPGNAL